MEKPKVGQTVWLKERDHRGVDYKDLIEVKITKVGNLYFHIDSYRSRDKYELKTGNQVSTYSSKGKIYFDKQEYLDEKEINTLYNTIKGEFRSWSNTKLTLDQLRSIRNILTPKK